MQRGAVDTGDARDEVTSIGETTLNGKVPWRFGHPCRQCKHDDARHGRYNQKRPPPIVGEDIPRQDDLQDCTTATATITSFPHLFSIAM